jgi:hypothetical protein
MLLARAASTAASLGPGEGGIGGVGRPSDSSCSNRTSIRLGSGCSWTRKSVGTPRCSATCATCSLVMTISCSISRWDSVCSIAPAPATFPSSSKLKSGSLETTSSAVSLRRSARAAAAARLISSGSAITEGGAAPPEKISSSSS